MRTANIRPRIAALAAVLLAPVVLASAGCSSKSEAVEPAAQAASQKPLTPEQVRAFATQDEKVQAEEGGFSFRR